MAVLLQPAVLEVIQQRTLRRLYPLYNRFRTANEYRSLVNEALFGPSAAVAVAVAVASITGIADSSLRRMQEVKFKEQRMAIIARLLDRVEELKPLLDATRELIREELELAPESS